MSSAASAIWFRPSDGLPGLRSLLRRVVEVDAVAPISGHVLDAVRTGTAEVSTIGPPADLSGVAIALADDPAEVAIVPDRRGQGLGTALVRAALERQGAVWAYGDLPAARAIAHRLELRRTRVLLQLRRALAGGTVREVDGFGGVTGSQEPPGVRIRAFEPGRDEQAFLRVNARAFAAHPEQGRLDLAGLRDEMNQEWFDPAGFFLAVTDPGDELLGFHWTKIHPRDESSGSAGNGRGRAIGEIYVLGVDPDAGVRGLGTALAHAGLRHLAARELDTVMLFVEADNDRAVRLYERLGFAVHLTNVVYRPR